MSRAATTTTPRRFAPPMPAGLRAKPLPASGDPDRLKQMLLEGAPPSAMKVYLYLDAMGRIRTDGVIHRATWAYPATIATETGLKESTVRATALPWLRHHGWVAGESIVLRGRSRTLLWCLWLLPFDPAGSKADLGGGVLVACGPESAEFGARLAPKTAPDNPYGLRRQKKKTTTDAGVVVFSAPPPGEEDGEPEPPITTPTATPPLPVQAAPEPAPVPSPAIDPALAREIDQGFPIAGQRAKVLAELPTWLGTRTVDWVIALVRVLADNNRHEPVLSFRKYAASILAEWDLIGYPVGKVLGPAKKARDEAARREIEARKLAEKAAKDRAEAEAEDRDRANLERWRSHPEDFRREIEAEVKAANPMVRQIKGLLEPYCVTAMLAREARSEVSPCSP